MFHLYDSLVVRPFLLVLVAFQDGVYRLLSVAGGVQVGHSNVIEGLYTLSTIYTVNWRVTKLEFNVWKNPSWDLLVSIIQKY